MMNAEKTTKRKRRLFRKLKPGTAPGTVAVDVGAHPTVIRVIAYGVDDMVEETLDAPEGISPFIEKWPVTWVDVVGLADGQAIEKLGEIFGLHKLALEDVVNVHQRAKVESYGDTMFIVARVLHPGERLETEQFSMFLGKKFVLTFQERPGDCFEGLRGRIRQGRKVLRKSGSDYLAYALIDSIIDHYFPILEKYDEKLDHLEQLVMGAPDPVVVQQIHGVRKDLLTLRRAIWPKREAINSLIRSEENLIKKETRLYLRDCYDHTIQVIDILENLREITSGMIELHNSNISNRMNEIMKVLTLIATIFIPLSFVAGLYGMNFDQEKSPWNMPELGWPLGYPFALLIMAVIAAGMLLFFRKRGWIGSSGKARQEEVA